MTNQDYIETVDSETYERILKAATLIEELLQLYNLGGDGFHDTPERVARFWEEFIHRPKPQLKDFETPEKYIHEPIRLTNFECWGLCPHHLLPVHYKVSVEYIPRKGGRVLGISKLPRLIDYCLRGLPLQEDLPHIICDEIMSRIKPTYVACQVTGMHLCMVMRGVKAPGTELTTSAWRSSGDRPIKGLEHIQARTSSPEEVASEVMIALAGSLLPSGCLPPGTTVAVPNPMTVPYPANEACIRTANEAVDSPVGSPGAETKED